MSLQVTVVILSDWVPLLPWRIFDVPSYLLNARCHMRVVTATGSSRLAGTLSLRLRLLTCAMHKQGYAS